MAYVNSWKQESGATTNTVTVSGVTAGNTLILVALTDTNASSVSSWPSGFSSIATATHNHDGASVHVAVKESAAGTEGSLEVICSNNTSLLCVEFSGRDTASLYAFTTEATTNGFSGASPTSRSSSSLTPSSDGTDIVCIAGWDCKTSAVAVANSFSTTSGTTGAWSVGVETTGATFRQAGIGYATQTTAGAFVVQATGTYSTAPTAGALLVVIGLKPSAGAPAGQPTAKRFGGVPGMGGGQRFGGGSIWKRAIGGIFLPERTYA